MVWGISLAHLAGGSDQTCGAALESVHKKYPPDGAGYRAECMRDIAPAAGCWVGFSRSVIHDGEAVAMSGCGRAGSDFSEACDFQVA